MDYQTYESYKDSGISWIGEIPNHWQMRKMKNLIFFQEGPGLRNWQFTDDGIRVICVTNITEKGIDFSNYEKFISEEEYYQIYQHFTVNNGDLLLSSSGNSWGKVAEYLDDETVILNTSTIRINENKDLGSTLTQSFIKWSLQSEAVREQLGLMMTGSCQPNFGPTHLAKVLVPFPESLKEQTLIANYLDEKTSEIDDNISKNKKLISLLEEKKVALINQTVTKGLDPNVPMKDSGIEWIGEIPEHWNMNRLKFLISKNPQYGANCEPEQDENKFDFRYIRITDIGDNATLNDSFVYLSEEDSKGFILNKNDILFARSGATVGKTYLYNESDGKCCFAGYLIRYMVNSNLLNPKYLLYFSFSHSYSEWIKIVSTQATIQNVSAEKYNNLLIPLPSIGEQNNIVNLLDDELLEIDTVIEKIMEEIILLEEYKTSLIHHVVTGKIDVRDEI